MIFDTRVAGIPCQCRVTVDVGYEPMRITGTGFGDAEPPVLPEFEYEILDQRGRYAAWLERKITDADDERLEREYRELFDDAA